MCVNVLCVFVYMCRYLHICTCVLTDTRPYVHMCAGVCVCVCVCLEAVGWVGDGAEPQCGLWKLGGILP